MSQLDRIDRFIEIYNKHGILSATTRASKYLIDKPIRKIYSAAWDFKNGPGVDVMERDWDNLIILDACRYDYFRNQSKIDGRLERVVSRGAHSSDFIAKNFQGRELHDTIYVTANPYYEKIGNDTFYFVEHLFDKWNKNYETILPEDVKDRAVTIYRENPNKRIIIHFMQPHIPYLGSTSEEIRKRVNLTGYGYYRSDKQKDERGKTWWAALEDGDITEGEIRQAYAETLDIVLDQVEDLVGILLDGKSVITADHGEMLGERGIITKRYAHPHDIYNKQLRVVPWLTPPFSNRRKITSDPPIGFDTIKEAKLNEHLESLGYK